ncbi:MAG: nucleoside-diphosphate sugar epimerase, partial [Mesorhizobium sp.]
VQERWFAKLYFVKPLVFLTFGLFWIVTGIVSLGPGWTIGINLMRGAGAGILSSPGVIAGALADIAIGLAILYRPTARWGLYAALALSGFYLVAGTILAPELWRDPLGGLLKIFPFVALNLVALAILKER